MKRMKSGSKIGSEVPCMFNPFEYTVSKTNSYTEDPKNQSDSPSVNFQESRSPNAQTGAGF
jgi:hypothetical protein